MKRRIFKITKKSEASLEQSRRKGCHEIDSSWDQMEERRSLAI